jgi:hypothetical protein
MQEKLVEFVAHRLPPLKRRKKPAIAVALAVLFGGFGLAVYLRSLVDAGVAAVGLLLVTLADSAGFPIGVLTILALLGQYAYTRVEASNRHLAATA